MQQLQNLGMQVAVVLVHGLEFTGEGPVTVLGYGGLVRPQQGFDVLLPPAQCIQLVLR
ncbi:hypothetical protein D3C81_2175310 [compost metagenome]